MVTEEQADKFGQTLSDLITDRLSKTEKPWTLRLSNVGKGARQLWYEKHSDNQTDRFDGKTLLKFIIGDVTEHLLLFLAEVAGNSVTDRQTEVDVADVKGHIDADINGVTVDVKSASPFSFLKFKKGTLLENDPFGYVEQLSGYILARGAPGAFLAMDKVSGELAYLPLDQSVAQAIDVKGRIEYLKKVLSSPTEPPRCYEPEPFGESGNEKLGVNCSYCQFKDLCWSNSNGGLGLRTFLYSSGPVYLTKVVKEPKVYEVPKF